MKKTNMHHLALAGILGLMAGAAQAQTTYNWVSPTTGSENWSTATWIPGTPAVGGALGDTLVFPAGTYTANNDLTGVHKLTSLNLNNGSAALTLSGNDLFFDGAGSYDNRLVAGVGGAMTVGNNITLGGNYNWYITPYGNVTLNGVISGGMGNGIWLADGGAQVVFANENNSFTNQIGILNNGSLVANANVNNGANGAFGNSYSSIQFPLNGSANTIGLYAGTGGLLLNRRINATVPMSAGGKRIIGGLHTSGWVTIANYIDGPDNQAIQFHAGSGAGVQINDGVIGAPDRTTSIIYEGGGQFSVYAAGGGGNTYSGSTTLRSGYVYLNYNDTGSAGNYSLGSSPVTTAVQLGDSETLSGATIAFISIGKTINHNLAVNNYGGNTYIGGGSSQPSVYAGDIALAKDLWVQSYFSGFGDTTLSGHINDSGAGEALRTAGDGTVILTSSNAYSGGTFVNSGNTVDAQHDGALGSGNVYVANSATLVLGGGAANDYIHSSANLVLSGGNPLVSLNFTGSDTINGLSFDGALPLRPTALGAAWLPLRLTKTHASPARVC
jgi:autotransporter-associated beta strand protein